MRQCQVLKDILQQCRSLEPNRRQLEDVGIGIRSVRYFDWRDERPQDESSCVREEYAIWSCRAVGVKCGGELSQLSDCFEKQGPKKMLAKSKTYFEPSKATDDQVEDVDAPCKLLERKLGDCVRENTMALEQRIKERKLETDS